MHGNHGKLALDTLTQPHAAPKRDNSEQQARLLHAGIPAAVAGSLLVGAVTATILWDVLPHAGIQAWLGIFTLIQCARLLQVIGGRKAFHANAAAQWLTIYRVLVLLTGATWGALPVFLFPSDLAHQVILPFVAAGVTGAAIATFAADRVSAMLFVIPALSPLCIRLFSESEKTLFAMGVLTLTFLAYLVAAAFRSERVFREGWALREQANEQNALLRASGERYRVLFVASRDAIMTLAPPSWRFTSGNPSAIKLFGAKDEQGFIAIEPWKMAPDIQPDGRESADKAREMIEIAMREGDHFFEWQHRRLDGKEFPATVLLTRMEIDGQMFLQATVRDITEQKRAEQALKQTIWERGERVKEARCFSGIIQVLLDEALSDEAALSAVVQLIPAGWKVPEDTCARIRFGEMYYATPGFQETQWRQHAEIPFSQQGVFEVEVCRINPIEAQHGGEIFLAEESALLKSIAQQIALAIGRRHTQKALIVAREEADRANLSKSEFLSSMSHELRTPMNAILGFGQLMEYDSTLSEEHHDNVQEILKAGHHLLRLIDEVLDLAKVESGHVGLSLEPVEVDGVVEECLSLVRTLADKRNIRLSHCGTQGVSVRADNMRLKQVLLNLLSNAIKYNRAGGSVTLEMRTSGTQVLRISVADTGPGIPAERLTELFQPFNRLGAEATEVEGTGIGLTITQRLVGMMGGKMDVESEVGVGSRFWIELPIASNVALACNEAVTSDEAHKAPVLPNAATQHLVLYIEDNPANIKLVTQILSHRQHIHLLTAHTPELGVELALTRAPALILLDINMPGMDGYQVLEVFKGEPSLKSIPVVAITANAMPRDIERGMKAGFTAYLTKPLDIPLFHATIDRVLQFASAK